MFMQFNKYADEIKNYCESNKLDFSKLKKMVKGCGLDDIIIQYHDPAKGADGLRDETPMPVVLWIRKMADGKLIFEQTEHTRKYLS